jgi:hypothetical protein
MPVVSMTCALAWNSLALMFLATKSIIVVVGHRQWWW